MVLSSLAYLAFAYLLLQYCFAGCQNSPKKRLNGLLLASIGLAIGLLVKMVGCSNAGMEDWQKLGQLRSFSAFAIWGDVAHCVLWSFDGMPHGRCVQLRSRNLQLTTVSLSCSLRSLLLIHGLL